MNSDILKELILIRKYFLIIYEKWFLYEDRTKHRVAHMLEKIDVLLKCFKAPVTLSFQNTTEIRLWIKQWMTHAPWRYIRSPNENESVVMKEWRGIVKKRFTTLNRLIRNHIFLYRRVVQIIAPHTLKVSRHSRKNKR